MVRERELVLMRPQERNTLAKLYPLRRFLGLRRLVFPEHWERVAREDAGGAEGCAAADQSDAIVETTDHV
jgi:hypothetical protein